jgi:hypothetical protein
MMKNEIAQKVIERANGYCEVCGGVAQESMALHHRKLRSQGGKDQVSNLIWVHHKCHNLGTFSIHNQPAVSVEKGWICPSWAEPHSFPFVKPDGSIVLLHDNGSESMMMEGD